MTEILIIYGRVFKTLIFVYFIRESALIKQDEIYKETKMLVCNMSVKFHSLHCILDDSRKILVLSVMIRMSVSKDIWNSWRNGINENGINIWWLTIVGATSKIVRKLKISGNTTSRNFYLNMYFLLFKKILLFVWTQYSL